MPNISRIKGKKTLKFGQVIEQNKRNIFLENHAENEAGGLVPDPFFFFNKALNDIKANGLRLVSISFDSPQLGKQLKQNM